MKLTEGWVTFNRIPCKKGFIDVWFGDAIDNPNNPEKHKLKLNSFRRFYRLNGSGRWCSEFSFERNFYSDIYQYCNLFTSEEVWSGNIIKEQ